MGGVRNCQLPGSLVITVRDVITVQFTRFRGRLFIVGLSTRLSPPDDGQQGTVSPGLHCPPRARHSEQSVRVCQVGRRYCPGEGSGTVPWERHCDPESAPTGR